MNSYFYFKELQKVIVKPRAKKRMPRKPLRLNVVFFLLSLSLGGLIIISQFVFPSIYFSRREIIGASTDTANITQSGELNNAGDYELPSLVISDTRREADKKNIPETFSLSIPKIGLENLTVYSEIDGSNKIIYGPILEKGVAHYLGTPLPGETGKSIIFGHSSFTWAFNKSNYLTIFTRLPELKIGDNIAVNINNKDLKFTVTGTKTIKPEGLTGALIGENNEPTLVLMTCVPPGMTTYRLLVFASMVR